MGTKSDHTATLTDGYSFIPVARIQFEKKFHCSFCPGSGYNAFLIKRDDDREFKVGADCLKYAGLTKSLFNGLPVLSESDYEEQKTLSKESLPKQHHEFTDVVIGIHVKHKTFGIGNVISVEKDRVAVVFENEERTFLFPDTFKRKILTIHKSDNIVERVK